MKMLRRGERFAAFSLGGLTVTVLSDGHADVPARQLLDAAPYQAAEGVLHGGNFRLPIHAFLISGVGPTVLIDCGAADAWVPTAGRLYDAMDEAGIAPASIDAVAITHCHVDHINGLIKPDGTIAFPNAASILVPAAEIDLFHAEARLQPVFARVSAFHAGEAVTPSITAIAAPGHEIGHSAFLADGGSERLLVWGDIIHVPSVQFADPGATWEFDADRGMARKSRLSLLARAAAERLFVAGAHHDFPAIGVVNRAGTGYSYRSIA